MIVNIVVTMHCFLLDYISEDLFSFTQHRKDNYNQIKCNQKKKTTHTHTNKTYTKIRMLHCFKYINIIQCLFLQTNNTYTIITFIFKTYLFLYQVQQKIVQPITLCTQLSVRCIRAIHLNIKNKCTLEIHTNVCKHVPDISPFFL